MSDLSTYAAAVRQLSREGFMRQFAHPFLLVKTDEAPQPVALSLPQKDVSDGDDDWGGNHTSISTILPKTGSFAVLRHNAENFQVHALICRQPVSRPVFNAEGELVEEVPPIEIAVGRAPENDIILSKPAVSKRHAIFSYSASPKLDGALLTDKGSRNGTFVKGRRVAPEKPVEVGFGDAVVLGDVAMSLIGAGALWEIIKQQLDGKL